MLATAPQPPPTSPCLTAHPTGPFALRRKGSTDPPEPPLLAPRWLGLDFVAPSALADIVLACDAASTSANFGAAGAPGPLTTIAAVIVSGLRPMAPAALLLAARLVTAAAAAPPARGGAAAGKEAPEGRARRLLQLLLRAAAGGGAPGASDDVITVGDGIAHALWVVASAAAPRRLAPGGPEEQRFVAAAAAVISALAPPEAARAAADIASASAADAAAGELCGRALVAAAEGADEGLAYALLDAPLGPGVWEAVWAVVASPARGTFCASARGLAAPLAALPTSSPGALAGGRTPGAAWGGLLSARGWAEVNGEVRGEPPGAAVTGPPLGDVLAGVLSRLPILPAGASHVAALARAAAPAELAAAADRALEALEATAYGEASAGAVTWLYALKRLQEPGAAGGAPLAAAPRALRLLCGAAGAVAPPELPGFLRAAGAAAARSDADLALLYACMAEGREARQLQGLLSDLAAAELPAEHAAAMLAVLGARMAPAARDAAQAAAGADRRLAGESVWQMGQRWTGPAPAATSAARARAPEAAAPAAGAVAAELAALVARIPHAPPPGGSEDAMQDPEAVAGLLRRAMELLSRPGWAPARPEAAAAAGTLSALAARRGWGDGDLAGLLCRLPAGVTLRLLLVAGPGAAPELAARRPALLAALARWHGADALAAALRDVYANERTYSLGNVAAALADAAPCFDGAAAAGGAAGGFVTVLDLVLADLRGAAPPGAVRHREGYAAALLKGLGEAGEPEEPAAAAAAVAPGGAGRPAVTARRLADLLTLVHALAPAGPAAVLLAAAGASLDGAGRAALAAALPGAARRTLGKGRALADEVAALSGVVGGDRGVGHAARAQASLRAATASGGRGLHADRAAAALSKAAGAGSDGHAAAAAAALRSAAASGGAGGHAAAAEASLCAAAGGGAPSAGPGDPAVVALREIGALLTASPDVDPLPFLRRALHGGSARLLLRALPAEAPRLPAAVTAPLLAVALTDFDAPPAEWETSLLATCAALDAARPPPPAVLSPRTRRAYAVRPGAARRGLLERLVPALQALARPNREGLVAAYCATLFASAAEAGAPDFEPAAGLLQAMLSPRPPATPAQALGASGAARLAGLLLSGPEAALPALDVLLPSLSRAFSVPDAGDAAAWFARGVANELPRLPLERAALGLTLLQPALAQAKALRGAALAVAEAHGRDAAAAALGALWLRRHGGANAAGAGPLPEAAAGDVLAALEMFEAAQAVFPAAPGAALVPSDGEDGAPGAPTVAQRYAEGAGMVALGVASLAVAARVAARAFGVGKPAARMLFGSWWVLGATVSAAALVAELIAAAAPEEGGEEGGKPKEGGTEGEGEAAKPRGGSDSGSGSDDSDAANNGNPFLW
jgi:hypothetical protein